jgi:hypothetical protein
MNSTRQPAQFMATRRIDGRLTFDCPSRRGHRICEDPRGQRACMRSIPERERVVSRRRECHVAGIPFARALDQLLPAFSTGGLAQANASLGTHEANRTLCHRELRRLDWIVFTLNTSLPEAAGATIDRFSASENQLGKS